MKDEIATAIAFLSHTLCDSSGLSQNKAAVFSQHLANELAADYKTHWYEDQPLKGSAFRCIEEGSSPVLRAAKSAGFELTGSENRLWPTGLTVWVDPGECSYRIGSHGAPTTIDPASPSCSPTLSGHSPTYSSHPQKSNNVASTALALTPEAERRRPRRPLTIKNPTLS